MATPLNQLFMPPGRRKRSSPSSDSMGEIVRENEERLLEDFIRDAEFNVEEV